MTDDAEEHRERLVVRRPYARRLTSSRARRLVSDWPPVVVVPAVVIVAAGLVIQVLRRDWEWWSIPAALFVLQFVVTRLTPGRFVLTIDDTGVTDRRLVRARHYRVEDVVALSWDLARRPGSPFVTGPGLVVLLRHDPWPKNLQAGACPNVAEAHLLLTEIAARGWPTDDRDEAASLWWYLDAAARRLDRHPPRSS